MPHSTLYLSFPFRMSPMEDIKADLKEASEVYRQFPYHKVSRVYLTGANPFAMNYENLKLRALMVRDYLIKCQTMAMFASIRDIQDQEVCQLKKLRAMGINGLSIGTESGNNETLALAGKGGGNGSISKMFKFFG